MPERDGSSSKRSSGGGEQSPPRSIGAPGIGPGTGSMGKHPADHCTGVGGFPPGIPFLCEREDLCCSCVPLCLLSLVKCNGRGFPPALATAYHEMRRKPLRMCRDRRPERGVSHAQELRVLLCIKCPVCCGDHDSSDTEALSALESRARLTHSYFFSPDSATARSIFFSSASDIGTLTKTMFCSSLYAIIFPLCRNSASCKYPYIAVLSYLQYFFCINVAFLRQPAEK